MLHSFILHVLDNYNYWVSVILMMVGFYAVISGGSLIKKIMGLTIFQTSVLLFYISIGNVDGATIPIITEGVTAYVNPLPHVLMLTAIVVGVATMAVGLAIAVRIKEEYGTIEEKDILRMDFRSSIRGPFKKKIRESAQPVTKARKTKKAANKKRKKGRK